MQVYAMKFHNFLRFGEKDNTVVFDLTEEQKRLMALGKLKMDDVYEKFVNDPVKYINEVKKRGIEKQIAIVGLINGDPDSSNGCGKSTIMEGICYAHYEKIVRKTANNDKTEKAGLSVVTKIDGKYPKTLKESYVEEYFEDNGSIYRIKRGRTFSKTQKSSQPLLEFECILANKKDSLSGHRTSDTKDSISNVITMDYDVFVNSQMFGQNDAGKYLTGTDKTKKEMLISLLRLEDVVVGCLEIVRQKKNKQEKIVSSEQNKIDFMEEMFLKAYNKYVSESELFEDSYPEKLIKNISKALDTGKNKNEKYSKMALDIESKIKELNSDEKIILVNKIYEEGTRLKQSIENVKSEEENEIDKFKSFIKMLDVEKNSLDQNVSVKENKRDNLVMELKSLNTKKENFDKDQHDKKIKVVEKAKIFSKQANNSLNDYKLKQKENSVLISQMESQKKLLSQEIKTWEDMLSNSDGNNLICDKCKSKVSKEHFRDEINDNKEKINSIDTEILDKNKANKKIEEEIDSLILKLKKAEKYIDEEKKLIKDFNDFESASDKINAKNKEIEDIKNEIKSIKDQVVKNRIKAKEYEFDIEKSKNKFSIKIQDINSKLEDARKEYKNAKDNAKVIQDEILDHKEKLNKIHEVKNSISEKIGFLKREYDHFIKLKEDLKDSKEKYVIEFKLLNRYLLLESVYGLDGIQTRIIKRYLPLLNIYIKEFLDILSRGSISVKMSINDKSKIDMIVSGSSGDSYEMMSGGEKMLVRLAVDISMALLSFSRSNQKPEVIWLDEIFGCMDVNNRDSTFEILNKLSDKFNRVMIISHEKEICDKIPAKLIIEKEPGDFGLSSILRIE